MFTDEQKKKYLENDSMVCPFCGSYQHIYSGLDRYEEPQDHIVTLMGCEACKRNWEEVHRLVDIREVKTNDIYRLRANAKKRAMVAQSRKAKAELALKKENWILDHIFPQGIEICEGSEDNAKIQRR